MTVNKSKLTVAYTKKMHTNQQQQQQQQQQQCIYLHVVDLFMENLGIYPDLVDFIYGLPVGTVNVCFSNKNPRSNRSTHRSKHHETNICFFWASKLQPLQEFQVVLVPGRRAPSFDKRNDENHKNAYIYQ